MGNIELIQPNAPLDLSDFVSRQENGYIKTEKILSEGRAYIRPQQGYGPQIIHLKDDDIYSGKVKLTGYEFNEKDGTVTVHFTENSPAERVHSNAKIVCVFPENKYKDKTKVHHEAPIRSMSFTVDHNGQHQEVEILVNQDTNTYILTVNGKSDMVDMNHPNPFKHSVTSFDMSHPWHPKRAKTDNYFQFLKEKLASMGRFNLRSSELVQIFSDLQTLTKRAAAAARTAAVPSTTAEVRDKLTESITRPGDPRLGDVIDFDSGDDPTELPGSGDASIADLAKLPEATALMKMADTDAPGEEDSAENSPGNYDPSNGALVPFPGDDEAPDEEDTSDASTDPGLPRSAEDDEPTTEGIEPADPVEPDSGDGTSFANTGDAEPTPIAPIAAPVLPPAPAPAEAAAPNKKSWTEDDPAIAVSQVSEQARLDTLDTIMQLMKSTDPSVKTLATQLLTQWSAAEAKTHETVFALEREADNLRSEKSAAEEERDAEKLEHAETNRRLKEVQATLTTETEDKEAALRAVKIRRETISSRDAQIGRLQTQIEQLEVAAHEAATALETAKTNLTNAEENRDRFRVGLQDTIRQKTELKAAHRKEIDEKNAELRTVNRARQQAEAERDAAQSKNRRLRLNNESLRLQKATNAEDLGKEQAKTAQLQADLHAANDLNQRWRTSWHELNDQATAMITENNRLRAELDRLRENQPKKSRFRRKK